MSIRWPRVLTPTYLSHIIHNQKNPLKALHIFNEARIKYPDYRHNGPVYATMINILSTSNRILDMKQLISQMKDDSCECQDSVFSGVITTYAKAGMLNEAVSLFKNLNQFNCVNWTESFNTLLQIMVKESKLESAHRLFLENFSKWEVKSRTRSLSWLIDVLCQKKRSDLALEVFQEMSSQYCYPTRETYQILMRGLCEDGRINEAIHLLYSMFWRISQKGSGEDVLIYKILLDTLCEYEHVDEASDILNKVLRKGLKAPKKRRMQLDFNLCRNGRDIERTKSLINDALIKGVIPSYESYNSMAVQLYAEGDLSGGGRVVQEMHDQGFTPKVLIYEAKVTALCKKGMIDDAEKVISKEMVDANCVPTVSLYNILIQGLCNDRKSTQALWYLNKMSKQLGCVPNKDTYSILVDGLCHDGNYIEASELLEKMLANSYWPDADCFSKVVKGLCLMGRPYEAIIWLEEMISQEKMPDLSAWSSLYLKAVARGLLALPVGAIVNALGAIALGAPVGTQYFLRTLNWSLLMSAFTVVPAASVYGSSWTDWHRIFAQTKLIGSIDYMICLPAHGAVIGAWFGAWPMPLDWERTWQEWPICVTYGAIIGYLVGMLASFGFVVFNASHQRMKGD